MLILSKQALATSLDLVSRWNNPNYNGARSVAYDEKTGYIYVTNTFIEQGLFTVTEARSFISRLNPDGTTDTAEWFGLDSAEDKSLYIANGIAVFENRLYVLNAAGGASWELLAINLETGKLINRYGFKELFIMPSFIPVKIEVDKAGNVYMTDHDYIYRYLSGDSVVKRWIPFENSQDISVVNDSLIVATNYGNNPLSVATNSKLEKYSKLEQINLATKERISLMTFNNRYIAILSNGDKGFFFLLGFDSSQEQELYFFDKSNETTQKLNNLVFKEDDIFDLYYSSKTNLLLVGGKVRTDTTSITSYSVNNCLVFSSDFDLPVNCASFNGNNYQFTLNLTKQEKTEELFWELDHTTLTNAVNSSQCLDVKQNLQLPIACASLNNENFSFTLDFIPDPDKLIWKLDRTTVIKK